MAEGAFIASVMVVGVHIGTTDSRDLPQILPSQLPRYESGSRPRIGGQRSVTYISVSCNFNIRACTVAVGK